MIETEPKPQAQNSSAPTTSENVAGLDLLVLLARHWRYILRFTLGAAVLTAIVVFLMPNWYTAETIVLPPQQTSMSSALMSQLGGSSSALASLAGASFGLKNPTQLYAALFCSRTVEDAVIRRFELQARYRKKTMYDTRRKFEDHSTVVVGTKDGLIHITVEDRDPKLAAAIANGYVEEFRKLSESLAITEASQRRLFFEHQLADAKEKLSAAEEAMKSTEQSTGVLQIDSQAKALIETAAVLRGQVVAKEVQIQAMRSYATDDNPQLVATRQQLAALQSQLAKLGGAGEDPESGLLVPKGRIPEAGLEYVRRLRDVKYNETLFEQVAKQLEIARLDEAREGAIIQVADPAVPPDKKSSPHRALIVILVTIGAFIFAAYWASLRERLAMPENQQRLRLLRRQFRKKQR
jgi:tyrosine-protein kinase Etk/Wzc